MKQLAQALADTFGVTVGYTTATGARERAEPMMKANIEITDTFNGEANYCWVRRYTLDLPPALSRGAIMRRVKRHIGWSGKRCVTVDYSGTIELRPYGECVVCFVTFN